MATAMAPPPLPFYLSLVVGNTRLHFARVRDDEEGEVLQRWDTQHITREVVYPPSTTSTATSVAGVLEAFLPPEVWSTLFPRVPRADKEEAEGASAAANTQARAEDASAAASQQDDVTAAPWPSWVELYIASVVPEQTSLWTALCPHAQVITAASCIGGLEHYPTLGVDRALSLRGAGEIFGWPVMVVDGGTALTFTRGGGGGEEGGRGVMMGGAIMPGIKISLESLRGRTAMLPLVPLPSLDSPLPTPRFAMSTPSAIQSGVVYAALAVVEDFSRAFWREEPNGTVVLTGGDALFLEAALRERGRMGWHAHQVLEGRQWVVHMDLAPRGIHWLRRKDRPSGHSHHSA